MLAPWTWPSRGCPRKSITAGRVEHGMTSADQRAHVGTGVCDVDRKRGRCGFYEAPAAETLRVDSQGSRVTSEDSLLLVRELDERLGLAGLIQNHWCVPALGAMHSFPWRILLPLKNKITGSRYSSTSTGKYLLNKVSDLPSLEESQSTSRLHKRENSSISSVFCGFPRLFSNS